jgi:hypothetical protein
MNKLLIPFFLILLSNCRVKNPSNFTSGYIKLDYVGETNKPIPDVVFYTDESFDTTTLKLGYTFRITPDEFTALENSIEENNSLVRSKTNNSIYEFTISKNNKDKLVLDAENKKATQDEFNSIKNALSKNAAKESIVELLSEIIHRI